MVESVVFHAADRQTPPPKLMVGEANRYNTTTNGMKSEQVAEFGAPREQIGNKLGKLASIFRPEVVSA